MVTRIRFAPTNLQIRPTRPVSRCLILAQLYTQIMLRRRSLHIWKSLLSDVSVTYRSNRQCLNERWVLLTVDAHHACLLDTNCSALSSLLPQKPVFFIFLLSPQPTLILRSVCPILIFAVQTHLRTSITSVRMIVIHRLQLPHQSSPLTLSTFTALAATPQRQTLPMDHLLTISPIRKTFGAVFRARTIIGSFHFVEKPVVYTYRVQPRMFGVLLRILVPV